MMVNKRILLTWAKEYMRLVLRDLGADQECITSISSPIIQDSRIAQLGFVSLRESRMYRLNVMFLEVSSNNVSRLVGEEDKKG